MHSHAFEAGTEDLLNADSLDDLLHAITVRAAALCDSETASILLVDAVHGDLYFRSAPEENKLLAKVRVPADNTSIAGTCLQSRAPVVVQNVASEGRHFKGSDRALAFVTRSILAVPMICKGDALGVLEAINKRDDKPFAESDVAALARLADLGASILRQLNEVETLRGYFNYSIEFLADLSDGLAGSPGRSQRIAETSRTLGRALGLSPAALDRLWMGGYCHDLGRLVLVSRSSPYDRVQAARLGSQTAASVEILSGIADMLLKVYERVDGSGQPARLRGNDIPIEAQILGLAVDLEAMARSADFLEPSDLAPYFVQRAGARFSSQLLDALRQTEAGTVPVAGGAG